LKITETISYDSYGNTDVVQRMNGIGRVVTSENEKIIIESCDLINI